MTVEIKLDKDLFDDTEIDTYVFLNERTDERENGMYKVLSKDEGRDVLICEWIEDPEAEIQRERERRGRGG